jgi:hypothetical protein
VFQLVLPFHVCANPAADVSAAEPLHSVDESAAEPFQSIADFADDGAAPTETT